MGAMEGKVAVVTGSTGGIGKAVAKGLAREGASVVLAYRSEEKAGAARREIVADADNGAVEAERLDLGSMRSVESFAAAFASRHDRLDVLVNNAGLFGKRGQLTEDGYEVHLGVMHLGHFLLTNLLLDRLRAGAPSRVVSVSALAHLFVRDPGLGHPHGEDRPHPVAAYCRAKLAQVLFTRELARREAAAGSGVTAYSLHPGVIAGTSLAGDDLPPLAYRATERLLPGPEEGASLPLYLATAPGVERHNGRYFSYRTFARYRPDGPSKGSPLAEDEGLCRRLWRASEEACKLPLAESQSERFFGGERKSV